MAPISQEKVLAVFHETHSPHEPSPQHFVTHCPLPSSSLLYVLQHSQLSAFIQAVPPHALPITGQSHSFLWPKVCLTSSQLPELSLESLTPICISLEKSPHLQFHRGLSTCLTFYVIYTIVGYNVIIQPLLLNFLWPRYCIQIQSQKAKLSRKQARFSSHRAPAQADSLQRAVQVP